MFILKSCKVNNQSIALLLVPEDKLMAFHFTELTLQLT